MMRRGGALLPLVLTFMGWSALPGAAQTTCGTPGFDASVSPSFVDDTDGNRALGTGLELGYCREGYDTRPRFPRARYRGLAVEGTILFDEMDIPQDLSVSGWLGMTLSLSERAPPNPNADPDEEGDSYLFDYGTLGLGARVQYESAEDLDEQAFVFGGELRWVDPRRSYLPSTVVTFQGVVPTVSEARDHAGLEGDLHTRLGIRAYWMASLPGPFVLEIEGAHFWAFGLEAALEAAGFDEGPFLAGELGLTVNRRFGPLQVDAVFAGYAWGQRPTAGADTKAFTLGVELGRP